MAFRSPPIFDGDTMNPELLPYAEPAKSMEPIHDHRWYAKARVRIVRPDQPDCFVRIPGEWHGKTQEQAEARARHAASDWIHERLAD
jgi:hypothetical protein